MNRLAAVLALPLAAALALPLAILPAAALANTALNLQADVVPSATPQEVQFVEHDFNKGDTSGWHIHHGVEMAYVLKGDFAFRIGGQGPIMLHIGDSIEVPRDTPHRVDNVGPGEGKLIISYLIDKGGPQKIPVPAPPGS
jgi:quercetin dioxygenase-like cupin family protein